jgi:acyl-coenzyme A thioesterase 7
MAATTTRRLATLMCPSHANLMGNVHGGSILSLMEQTGRIASQSFSRGPTALVGASATEFRLPIHVGEVASVDATVDYVGRHVMRVSLDVVAEEMASGVKRRTNTAKMWYCAIDIVKERVDRAKAIVSSREVPRLDPMLVAPDAQLEHRRSAEARDSIPLSTRKETEFPIRIQHVPGPDSVANHPFISAGYVLKLLDEAAALAAVSHTRHQCVTVLLHKVCFSTPIQFGDLCTVRAAVTYTSNRSCEVVAQVWASPSGIRGGLHDLSLDPVCAVEARFVFVALDNDGKVVAIPQLPDEMKTKRWEVGAASHQERLKGQS